MVQILKKIFLTSIFASLFEYSAQVYIFEWNFMIEFGTQISSLWMIPAGIYHKNSKKNLDHF